MQSDAEKACALALRFAQPSLVCSTRDVQKLQRLAECLKVHLRTELAAFLLANSETPVQVFYGSDCTPHVTKETWKKTWGMYSVRRAGRQCSEFIIQRLFAINTSGEVRVLLDEPLPLADKTAWTHIEVFRQAFELPRLAGHRAICSHHYAWDRAVQAPCARHVRQLHEASHQHLAETQADLPTTLLKLTSWVTSSACCNHDVHNALKWSVLEYTKDPVALRGSFIVVESLRNGYSLLVKNVNLWLAEVIVYADWEGFPCRECYTLLGLDPEFTELATDLQMRFEDGHLKIAEKWKHEAEVTEMVVTTLLHIWKFKKFSDSRWLSLGPSCRSVMAALMCGLKPYVTWLLARPGNSRYYLGGFLDYYSKSVAELIGIVATSAFVPDAALASMLDDDRLVHTVSALEADLVHEAEYVAGIAEPIWAFFGQVLGWEGSSLRQAAISGSVISAGFILWRLRHLHEHPWTLCRGDLDKNLDELQEGPAPTEETALKVYNLVRMGYSRDAIKDGLRLLGNSSFSTTQVEEGHVFGSNIMQQHRMYGENTLRCRALVASVRPLLEVSPEEKRMLSAEQKLRRLARKQPQRISGRHMYVKDLVALASHRKALGRDVGSHVSKMVIKKHGPTWRDKDVASKRRYEAKAKDERARVRDALDEKREELTASLQVERARLNQQREGGLPPLRMSSARWSAAQKLKFDEYYQGPAMSHQMVEELRGETGGRIGQPTAAMKEVLEAMPVQLPRAPAPPPSWLTLVTDSRAFFADTAFRFTDDTGDVFYAKFAFARQALPRMAAFVKLDRVALPEPAADPAGFWAAEVNAWHHAFQLDWSCWNFTGEDAFGDDWEVHVLTDIVMKPGGIVVSDASWRSLQEVEAILQSVDSAPVQEQENPAPGPEPPVWANLPWLIEHFPVPGAAGGNLGNASGEGPQGDDDGGGVENCDGDEAWEPLGAEEALDQLYERRFHWRAAGPPAEASDFQWVQRGGWSKDGGYVAYDGFKGLAVRGEPTAWCVLYDLTPTASFSTKVCGEDGALQLARLWCHRMQWLYDKFCQSGDPAFEYTVQALSAYQEPAEAEQLEGDCSAACRTRLLQLRKLRPRLGSRGGSGDRA